MAKGVIVLAHGSPQEQWVDELVWSLQQAGVQLPSAGVQLTLLQKDLEQGLAATVTSLQQKGYDQLRLIPLLVAPVGGHWRDIVSFCQQTGIELGPIFGTDQIVLDILVDRYQEAVGQQSSTGVILVGHGVRRRQLVSSWNSWAQELTQTLARKLAGRREVQQVNYCSLYPDNLRWVALAQLEQGLTPIVLPLCISRGLLTTKLIPAKLTGLSCIVGAPYLPHLGVGHWVARQINEFHDR